MRIKHSNHRLLELRGKRKRLQITSRTFNRIAISPLRTPVENEADSHPITHEGAPKSASKSASRFVQREFDSSLTTVRRCYTGVLVSAKAGYGGKSVRFRPSPPFATHYPSAACELSKPPLPAKMPAKRPGGSYWLVLLLYCPRTAYFRRRCPAKIGGAR